VGKRERVREAENSAAVAPLQRRCSGAVRIRIRIIIKQKE